ncbi:Mpv17-like protein 2 [Aphelenchoides bicaudatus]|nr:Mpv17-like protein 2 [Aphelenchoides bicaudatus]
MSLRLLVSNAFSPRYLLFTNTTICCTLFGVADVVEQKVNNNHVDWVRAVRVGSIGFVLGPMNHFWYKFLERKIAGPVTVKLVAKKILADISVSPIFANVFISGVAFLEGASVKESLAEYRRKFFRVLALDCCVWPPTQSINFGLVPARFRVLYVSIVQLNYNIFLTYIKHNEL